MVEFVLECFYTKHEINFHSLYFHSRNFNFDLVSKFSLDLLERQVFIKNSEFDLIKAKNPQIFSAKKSKVSFRPAWGEF